ncbi:hypothetical protein K466DRAFT_583919 [Polyporus arcularius HHB13444]|uniref:Uncharacterized protein n=1 Tax=Polyporus arcularius HHB13444 TaxID=1314778 RepID=A0A5C3PL29_9APHY|nr:hypothetical protein K466DRAFT_583919 [Polyporus arcularius HHB13444]
MCYQLNAALSRHYCFHRYALPGTHGGIFPWDPPPHGIPKAILDELAKMLVEQVLLRAADHGRQVANESQLFTRADPYDGLLTSLHDCVRLRRGLMGPEPSSANIRSYSGHCDMHPRRWTGIYYHTRPSALQSRSGLL